MRLRLAWLKPAWLALLFLVPAELYLAVFPARAIQQVGEYWFSETIALGAVDLPDGVSIRPSAQSDRPRATLTIENQGDTLLFVLSLNYKNVLVMDTPDPLWRERVELAHEVASYLAAPNHPAHLDMPALTDLDHALVDRNVFDSTPPPAGVAVPGAQTSKLLLVYDGQVILVPFTLSYQINPIFAQGSPGYPPPSPTQHANLPRTESTPSAQSPGNSLADVGLLMALGLGIAVWLVWRKTHRDN